MSCTLLKCKSRELRGGKLMTDCDCRHRNGLQYDCPRTECQGKGKCIKGSFPKCCPSLFANRFEMVSMGKSSHQSKIRVFNNGSM